jgi:predicted dehydrogenase
VGTGAIGRNHARILCDLPGTHLTAICDTNPDTAREVASMYKAEAVGTMEEFIPLVDAATVATPTPTHFEIARRLLAAGKQVLIEKPIAEKPEHAWELVRQARDSGLILQVGHIERFNPVLGALESRLNNPRFIEAHRLSPYPGRSIEIGVVLDLMIHDLEIILHLVRSPVKSLDAVGIPVLSASEDIANVRLRFENGCVANITASRVSPERLRKIRVFQQNAYLSLDYQKQEAFLYRLGEEGEQESSLFRKLISNKETMIVSQFAGRKIVREPVPVEKQEPLKLELAAFVECARLGLQPRVSGSEAAKALELALRITEEIEQADPRGLSGMP